MKILNLYDFISSVEHRKQFLRMFTLLFPIQQKQEPGTGLQRPKKQNKSARKLCYMS